MKFTRRLKMVKQSVKKVDLSIVIVNYNSGEFLSQCLKSLKQVETEINLDLWIVDNASSDNSLNLSQGIFPRAHYINNKGNIGFGAANNQALSLIKSEYILMLNPDTEVENETLPYMLKFMESHPDVGAATCLALLENGKMDWGYHRGLPTPWASLLYFLGNDKLYHLTDRDMSQAHEVDAISGSFFLTRKSVLDKVGLFDEDYWLYAEDLDLSYRIQKAGYKIIFVPQVKVTHIKGVSSGIKHHSQEITTATQQSRFKAFNSFYETMKIFYQKNLAQNYPFFINWLVYLGINLRWALAKRKLKV